MVVLILNSRLRSAYLLVDQSDICDIIEALKITTSDIRAVTVFMSSEDDF